VLLAPNPGFLITASHCTDFQHSLYIYINILIERLGMSEEIISGCHDSEMYSGKARL
jgi:hypothetical protein